MEKEEESKVLQVANWLTENAVGGFGPLSGADDLALEYLNDSSYENNDKRVESLINWETTKNFSTGFITGLGGFVTLPVTIPASLGASWILQMRMAAAIARIYGHDLKEDRVRTLLLCIIIGQDIKEVCKQVGIKVAQNLTYVAIRKLPVEMLKRINRAVATQLVTKAGAKGLINLTKLVPVVGGVVGGTFDAVTCRITAKAAQMAFRR
ncbi:MAG: EcsC family protein [Victivallales bacterium]|nr:EcsC family protein [bacterium]MDD7750134.1 EcsC family protein [bacterium]MDY5697187.1 EcsC family protein [Victivallales bacterium]